MGEFGAVSVVSGHIRGRTNTLPLHVEALFDEYNFAAAHAVASLLAGLALVFIGLPFVVRTLQPVLEELDPSVEESAACLGASRGVTFSKIIFPAIAPALLTGFAMAFARGIGEYGSVIFIAGNLPMKSEIASLLIVTRLEQYDYAGAAALAVTLLSASFAMLLVINTLQSWSRSRHANR
jgi:sulfate transport system permease protein